MYIYRDKDESSLDSESSQWEPQLSQYEIDRLARIERNKHEFEKHLAAKKQLEVHDHIAIAKVYFCYFIF